jgi:predicted lipoprotein with Yx(FWY)xxD motif
MKAHSHATAGRNWLISLLVLTALILAACGPAEIPETGDFPTQDPALDLPTDVPLQDATATMPVEATATTQVETATPEAAAAGEEAQLNVATDPELGVILVGNDGMTLYMFTVDEPNTVNCSGDCLVQWPPLVTQGNPVLGTGVDPSLVGTAPLPDGRMIVTYNEMPLYYWINDTQPGDTTGQGVGDVWYVVSPQGEPIGADGPAAKQGAVSEDEAEIEIATDPQLGEILVGKDGMTLYIFTNDAPNTVNCVDNCLVNWPPLVTEGNPQLGEGIDEDLIGTAELPDGRQVVTYNEMPLYYWANDAEPGDTTGQGVGGVWYVISPEGEVINP